MDQFFVYNGESFILGFPTKEEAEACIVALEGESNNKYSIKTLEEI